MNLSSDDESSEGDTEYYRPNEKINLKSSPFKNKKKVHELIQSDSEDDEELPSYTNTELLSQILKNLNDTNQSLSFNKSNSQISQDSGVDCEELQTTSRHNYSIGSITDLLLQGEQNLDSSKTADDSITEKHNENTEKPHNIPESGIEIVCSLPNDLLRKRGKKRDLQDLLRTRLNQRIKAHQLLIHKVGLLCWLSHGFYLNRLINNTEVLGCALSLVSANNYPKDQVTEGYLNKFTIWFKKTFSLDKNELNNAMNKNVILKALESKKIKSEMELVLIYIAILRAMGLKCRLVISLSPPERTVKKDFLLQPSNSNETTKPTKDTVKSKSKTTRKSPKKKVKIDKDVVPENSTEALKQKKLDAKKKAAAILKNITIAKKKLGKKEESKNENDIHSRLRNGTKSAKRKAVPEIETDSDEYLSSEEEIDNDFHKKISHKVTAKTVKNTSMYKKTKLLSSEEDENDTNKLNRGNYWTEVYVESEATWMCIDVVTGKLNSPNEIHKRAPSPVLYVIGWNNDGLVKDVTRRYCSRWLTVTRKQRIDENWWKVTLNNWKEKNDSISKAEDELLLRRELELPLPKTISECKGHPLYALVRHLLKYEALYPENCTPLGYLPNKEAIYSRFCVHTLMSRQTWLKQARIVKPKQEPYKIVKSMPKYDKLAGTVIKDQPLELFGKWQTDPYVAPEAKDGIVPRNEYGNVDLFKKSMLPKGTVHIELPGLNRIARKLNIDCAPAVVGFNFGCRGALPATEGYVVCEEFEDVLREAWETEQIEAQKRAAERMHKVIYGNWKKIIKGVLIKARLSYMYEFNENKDKETQKQKENDDNDESKKETRTRKGKNDNEESKKESKSSETKRRKKE